MFLDIRVFNTSKETLAIDQAEVVVEESFPDLEPILRLTDASTYGGVICEIVNFSVNRVHDCEVAFDILPPNAKPKFESYQFVEKLEPFSESATFSLARAMDALGMDAGRHCRYKTMHDDDPSREATIQRAQRGTGPFSNFVRRRRR